MSMPKGGTFKAFYNCAPEDMKFDLRKKAAESFGFFDCDGVQSKDVRWITGLTEVPSPVLDLLEFFISRYAHAAQAFDAFDGPGGNGVITMREFDEGLVEMNCHIWNNLRDKAKLAECFRYLDPGGEGSVSKEEWGVLEQLWNELHLSLKEFAQFVVMRYGMNLMDAWKAFDIDGQGELTEEEWLAACDNIDYFGPAKSVFAFMDAANNGDISWHEFKTLESFLPEAKY